MLFHRHKYVTTIVKASCITRGYTIHKCRCGDEYKDNFTNLADHEYELIKKEEPSCVKEGIEVYQCKVCGDKEEKKINALGHKFSDWKLSKRASCEEDGEEIRSCENCSEIEKKAVKATGHKFGDWKLNQKGQKERFCVNCGKTETRNVTIKKEKKENITSSDIKIGSIIKYGSYYQSNSSTKEPIEWQVLEVKDNKALIISKYALDCKPYNEEDESITWEDCTLRSWLNNEFIINAFTPLEQQNILLTTVINENNPLSNTNGGNDTQDKIFCLSIDEVYKYFKDNEERECEPTKYAVFNGASVSDRAAYENTDGNCWWWLRSPGTFSRYSIAVVEEDGRFYYSGFPVYNRSSAVRPALWVDLLKIIYNNNQNNEIEELETK